MIEFLKRLLEREREKEAAYDAYWGPWRSDAEEGWLR